MKRKTMIWMFAATLLTLFTPAAWAADDDDDVVKVVYQCDFADVQRVHLMLNTLNNAVKYYEKHMIQYQIDVVALGPCLQYVMKDFKETGFAPMPYLEHGGPTGDGTRSRIKSLKLLGGDNLTIYACQNTMDKKNVKASQIEDGVEITPGGIVKVIDDQLHGFAYIKIQ